MRNIVIFHPASANLNLSSLIKDYRIIENANDERIWIENNIGDFVEFIHDDSVINYYDADELKYIIETIGEKVCIYIVNFKNIKFLKEISLKIADREDLIIDNDFDLITRGNEFAKLCREKDNWDWADG